MITMYGFRNVTKVMREKSGELDMEIHFKDAFRAFSKDDEGEDPKLHCVLRFVNIYILKRLYMTIPRLLIWQDTFPGL